MPKTGRGKVGRWTGKKFFLDGPGRGGGAQKAEGTPMAKGKYGGGIGYVREGSDW